MSGFAVASRAQRLSSERWTCRRSSPERPNGHVPLSLAGTLFCHAAGAVRSPFELVPSWMFDIPRFELPSPRTDPKDTPVAAINRASRGALGKRADVKLRWRGAFPPRDVALVWVGGRSPR